MHLASYPKKKKNKIQPEWENASGAHKILYTSGFIALLLIDYMCLVVYNNFNCIINLMHFEIIALVKTRPERRPGTHSVHSAVFLMNRKPWPADNAHLNSWWAVCAQRKWFMHFSETDSITLAAM